MVSAILTIRGSDITVHLVSASKKVSTSSMFTVKDKNDEQVYKSVKNEYCFDTLNPMDWESHTRMGYEKALEYIRVYGALVIEVHMKPTKELLPPFVPENPLMKIIQDKFLDKKSSDILFEVCRGKVVHTTKILVVKNLLLKYHIQYHTPLKNLPAEN